MYILYLITSGCRWKMYDPSTPLGSCFQFSSLSCFSHPWLNKTNAHAICSSFGYRYYSTRCWLVRHRLLTTNRWNKILRIHSGYDLSSGAVCRFCDSFLDSDHDDRWWCLWNLHDDFSFYHAGIKNVVANISDWHPFKNQKNKYAYLRLSAWHVRPKYNGGRPPDLSNAARLSTFSNKT